MREILSNSRYKKFQKKTDIKNWLDRYQIKKYIINDDLSVDVNGDVNISNNKLKFIPIKFRNVTNNFYCYNNQLLSLTGSPKTVGGNFDCGDNQLVKLAGSPKTVGGEFYCANNKLTNLAGSPKSVGGSFYCYNNPLISLLEFINCKFQETLYLDIDKKNFKQKELIQILKKYTSVHHKSYELTSIEFNDRLKPVLEKEILQQKINKNKCCFELKLKPSFI